MRIHSKRFLWVSGTAVLVILLAAGLYVFTGSAAVEAWVGSQLLQISKTYLTPEMHFDHVTYLRPRTIILDNLTLSSPDPANPGQSVVILSVKRARLELTEIPRRGKQVKFSEVVLDSPEIHAVAGPVGGPALVGFSEFMKSSKAAASTAVAVAPTATGPATSTAPSETATGTMKLSDWLLIRHIEIKDGNVSYDPRTPGTPAVWLDGINATLHFKPAVPATPGVYTLDTTISRKPAFELNVQGGVNIDTLSASLEKMDLTLDLQEKNIHFFPPELQKVLQSFEVTGQLHATAVGNIPFMRWQQSTLEGKVDLSAARVAAGEHRLAVESCTCEALMAGGVVTLRKGDARLLGGEVHASARIPLEGTQPAEMKVSLGNLKIQQLLRTVKEGEAPLYAGSVIADINVSAPLSAWNKQAAGGGTFSIKEGRIVNIPVLGPIVTEISKTLKTAAGGDGHTLTDTAEGTLSFAGDSVRIDSFDGKSGAIAMRGTGTIGFDQKLNMRFNAGLLEKLQDSLGGLGAAWAKMSDAVAGYKVGGTLAKPEVSLEIGKGP